MDDGKAIGSHQHHGHAIGKTQQHGNFARRAHDGVTALGNLLANVFEVIGSAGAHHDNVVPMHLVGHEQIMLARYGTHGVEYSTTILLNGKGVITYMRAQIERGVRCFGHTTGALGKGKKDIPRPALYQRNSIMVDTRNVVRTCCHTKAS